MQLKSAAGLKSLTVSSALVLSPTVFLYNDFNDASDVNSIALNPKTNDYIKETNENVYTGLILRSNFEEYLAKWEKNTLFYSFSNQIIKDIYFQKIIAMGERVVPLIVEKIKQKPSTLVWALNIIYDTKISSKPETTIEKACKLWVKSLS
ncbi:hypothetical protein FACS189440_21370 [Bacteroidia bacterium]|nr:hypothetical protein FACS189440_21370 [Bacteroidia bacterium]